VVRKRMAFTPAALALSCGSEAGESSCAGLTTTDLPMEGSNPEAGKSPDRLGGITNAV
jgi:hypothetical protein